MVTSAKEPLRRYSLPTGAEGWGEAKEAASRLPFNRRWIRPRGRPSFRFPAGFPEQPEIKDNAPAKMVYFNKVKMTVVFFADFSQAQLRADPKGPHFYLYTRSQEPKCQT